MKAEDAGFSRKSETFNPGFSPGKANGDATLHPVFHHYTLNIHG
jgi:hypothetical protein